ncbi:MAG: ABC transporter ATP-binding protein [Desulfuromonadaceae bacterium]|nr:ABC transporter ATP-binding protein [Desulfuromonadaceae bacterium]MDD5105013.1 ABC transporter ATP-binding protein [Desulfuromonadaceae bacterium]
MNGDVLKIDGLCYRYPGAPLPALTDISCTVRGGECVCLTGDSGCGKTTLLLAIKGLLRGGSYSESIKITEQPNDDWWSTPVGLVFQNAESQILCTTVSEEVAFGPENLCMPPKEIALRIRKTLRAVGLEECETRHVERFSAGQKQRLTIASALSMNPSLLLLDEPTSQLDSKGKQDLYGLLTRFKSQGYTIIMAEHDPRPFTGIIDRYLPMTGGRVGAPTSVVPDSDRYEPKNAVPAPPTYAGETSAVITMQEVCLTYPETGVALKQVSLKVMRGERIHLFGSNGAGKSSLLRCLAGLETPDSGTVVLAGITSPHPEQLPGNVGVLFQNPSRQLFAESVYEEVAFTLRRMGASRQETERVVAEALSLCGIGHLAERAPLTLSFGEQHRVALAVVVAPQPGVLLLDEPFAGLDFPQRLSLLDILAKMPGRYGTTVVIASHDELPDHTWADRTLKLSGGQLDKACR